MKLLTIENIERLKYNGVGTSDSPVVVLIDETPNQYQMTMDWDGYLWNVVLDRNADTLHRHWVLTVQRHGKMYIQDTAMSEDVLSTPHQFMLIVEVLMKRIKQFI